MESDLSGHWRHFWSLSCCQASQKGQDPGLWISVLSHSYRYYLGLRTERWGKRAYVHMVIHSCTKMLREQAYNTLLISLYPSCLIQGLWDLSIITRVCQSLPGVGLGPNQRYLGNTKELKALTSPAGKIPLNFV